MKQTLLFLIILCLSCELKAQTDYRPGYIITLSGDTVYGQIDYRGDYTMGHVCRFESGEGTKTEYAPNDIRAYRFIDSKYYVSRIIKDQAYFLEYLIKGKMDIFFLRDDQGDHYYMEKEGNPVTEIPFVKDIREINGKEYFYQSTRHQGLLGYATAEVPQLKESIIKIKEPGHGNLIKLAKSYHEAVCEEGEQCIVFERPLPLFRIQAEPVAGHLFSLRQRDNPESMGFNTGVFYGGSNIYVWLPRTSENWYFKTGVLYTHGPSVHLFMVPFQFAYVYPKGRFRPTFAGGINYYILKDNYGHLQEPIPAYSVGLLTLLSSQTSFSVNLEVNTESLTFGEDIPTFILPSYKIFGLAASIGIRHTF